MSGSINTQNNMDRNQGILQLGSTFGVLAWTGDELLLGEAQNGVKFDFEVKFHLEGQGQSPRKTIEIFTKAFYTYGSNVVILAWTGVEYRADKLGDGRDGRTQATIIPGSQYWRRVKTRLTIVYSTVYSGTDQRKHQSSASLAFVLGIHRWPVNSPHKGPVTRKMFPFDDVSISSGDNFHYGENILSCYG